MAGPVDGPLVACWAEPRCALGDDPSTMRTSTCSSLGDGVPSGTGRTSQVNIAVTGIPCREGPTVATARRPHRAALARSFVGRGLIAT